MVSLKSPTSFQLVRYSKRCATLARLGPQFSVIKICLPNFAKDSAQSSKKRASVLTSLSAFSLTINQILSRRSAAHPPKHSSTSTSFTARSLTGTFIATLAISAFLGTTRPRSRLFPSATIRPIYEFLSPQPKSSHSRGATTFSSLISEKLYN